MNLIINQSTDRTEQVTTECIDKLYNLSKSNTLDSTSYLRGSINAAAAYEDAVTFLNAMWGPNLIVTAGSYYIRFADSEVESVLKTALNKAKGEGITTQEAATTNLGTLFKNNTDIETFEELHHFSYTGGNFEGCSNLHTVDIGNKDISPLSFRNCANLEKINGSTAEPGVIIIPEETTSLNNYIFSECPKISVVYLPDTLTSLYYRCFQRSINITEIHFGLGISQILTNVFYGIPNLTKVYIKNLEIWMACNIEGPISNSHHLYLENDGNPVEITSLDLTGKIAINGYVFYGCSYITSVLLDTALTSIGNGAFGSCTNLVIQDLNLPNLTTLGSSAFYNTKVQTISNLGFVSTIPNECFRNAPLTSITFPQTLTSIGTFSLYSSVRHTYSFYVSDIDNWINCTKAESFIADEDRYDLYLNNTLVNSISLTGYTTIKQGAFRAMRNAISITLPSTITTIKEYAFFNSNVTINDINLPNLTTLERYAFAHNKGTESATINTVSNLGAITSIPEGCFQNVTALTSVTIPNSVTRIGAAAFYGCTNLTGIISIPEGVTSIDYYAFYRCNSLTSVTIPSTVTTIGSWAFLDCRGLTSITINAVTPPTLAPDVFKNTNNCPIYVPVGNDPVTGKSYVDIYKETSGWSTYASRIQAIPNS